MTEGKTNPGVAGQSRVVDTNVLLVASAADAASPFPDDATPVEEAALRGQVLDWLQALECSDTQVVLDYGWAICGEYQNKLASQDYGWLLVMHKQDRNQVSWVGLEEDADGNAVLPPSLREQVPDRADRKMVAAVLAARAAGQACCLVNACDSDWYDCQAALEEQGVKVEQLLHDWLHDKWRRGRE